MLGDLLAAAINANVGAYKLAPMATEIEAQTVRWIAELIGFPVDCGGLLVSGGNMANVVGFLAACAANGAGRAIYASSETHTWIQKAAELSGLGTEAIRWLPVDGGQRLRPDALHAAIAADHAAGIPPLIAVGSAGTVGTGAVDPLPEMAEICRQEGVWFHVDGAYGGLAAQVPGAPHELRGQGGPEVQASLDELNRRMLARVEQSGEAFLSNALVGERFALRACIVNFNTSEEDVDALPDLIARYGRELER